MMTTTFREQLNILLIKTLFIAILATAAINLAGYFYALITSTTLPNFELLGRWFMMILRGQWSTGLISNETPVAEEQFIGILGHFSISLLFSATYLLMCKQALFKKIPLFISGWLFGLVVAIFPIFVEYPSMGIYILSFTSPHITPAFFRILTCHSFFGISLGLGNIWLSHLQKKQN